MNIHGEHEYFYCINLMSYLHTGVNPKLADKSKHGSQDPVKEEERKVDLFDKEAEDTK